MVFINVPSWLQPEAAHLPHLCVRSHMRTSTLCRPLLLWHERLLLNGRQRLRL